MCDCPQMFLFMNLWDQRSLGVPDKFDSLFYYYYYYSFLMTLKVD